ncbi:unnamed protein product [Gongylonema pulchrum]|uniref:Guanylate cyclase domain-containing protein n=1 Tax=Gongylonema pulchrum TaxID=637853 RepID=A0A183CY49_9BILA|nr:unnamed protein product [Gongylonema pulchrum]
MILVLIDASPVVRFWSALDHSDQCNLLGYVANVIASCADRMNEVDRIQLTENFGNNLIGYRTSECYTVQAYHAFARLCRGVGEEAPGAQQLLEFNRNLIEKSLKTTQNIILRPVDAISNIPLSQEK